MTTFRVWAPRAGNAAVEVSGRREPMRPGPSGWWSAALEGVGAGADYAFVTDGGDPLPDPRSPWQPNGVHGPSRTVDHGAFHWTDSGWQAPPLSSAVVYELHVGTFSMEGTFAGAVGHLDHLVELGISHVELMPVQEFSGQWGWGYDGVDLFAPHHCYGEPAGLKALVNACHERGLAVLLDVVYNHLGPAGNYLSRFGPYFSTRHATPWGEAVNLDAEGSYEVRRFLCDNALMWLRDYHFDGLRLDAVHQIFDASAVHFLEQLAEEVAELGAESGRHLVVIAESDLNDPRLVRPREAGGYGLDAQWSDDFHHALHTVLTGEQAGYYADFGSLADLAKSLQMVFVYDGRYSACRARIHGRPIGDLPGWRFLGFLQNHDQVGNRAKGDRSARLMSLGRLKIGAALVLCSPFVPMLFQGEEFAASTPFPYFSQHQELQLARGVSEGRKREFQAFGWDPLDIPDPQDPQTFRRARLDWNEVACAPHAQMLEWHRRLIALRRSTPALCDGRLREVEVQFDEERAWLTMTRGPIVVALNLAAASQVVPVAFGATVRLSSDDAACRVSGKEAYLGPDSVLILEAC